MRAPERSSQRHFELLLFPNVNKAKSSADVRSRRTPWRSRVIILNMFTLAILAWLVFGLLALGAASVAQAVLDLVNVRSESISAVGPLRRLQVSRQRLRPRRSLLMGEMFAHSSAANESVSAG